MRDLTFALRQLVKAPGLAAVVVLTLTVGIGANTAMFSVINTALLQPLPYSHAEQLVDLMEGGPHGGPNGSVSGGAFKDWREHSEKFAGMAVFAETKRNLTGTGEPERVSGLAVSAEYLTVLGVAPQLGRGFAAEETRSGGSPDVVLLEHAFWQSRFGGDPAVIGRTLSLDQVPHTIVGVLPPRSLLQNEVQFLVPMVVDAPGTYWGRDAHWRRVIGRLRPGDTAAAAQVELRAIKQRLNSEYPPWKQNWTVLVTPLQELYVGQSRPMFLLLLGAVSLVLLIACANVTNLLLARSQAKVREFAVRMALGAGPWRLVRQTLWESLLLAAAGGTLGVLFAAASLQVLPRLLAVQLPFALYPQLDLAVLGFSLLVAASCGVVIAALPAWRAARIDPIDGLKEASHGSPSQTRRRAQSLVVVSQFALTLVLLVGTGLLLRSFARLLEVDPGFNPRSSLAFDLTFPAKKYATDDDRLRFTRELLERIRALPGVEAAGAGSSLPLSGMERGEFFERTDRPAVADRYSAGVSSVSGDYFLALGLTLQRGRLFTEMDNTPTAHPVVIVDTGVVRDLFPNEDPIGRQARFLGKTCEIVGVVGAVHHRGFEQTPRPWVYGPQAQFPSTPSIVVRSRLPAATLVPMLRQAVQAADPDQPIANVRTFEEAVDRSLASRRVALGLLGVFACVAVGLACVGIYGVIAQATRQRTREFSIRSALGAQRRDIVRLVVMGALQPSVVGMAMGVIAAIVLGQVLRTQLFEVQPHDPAVLVGAILLLTGAAILAVWAPARRAARVSPAESLRAD